MLKAFKKKVHNLQYGFSNIHSLQVNQQLQQYLTVFVFIRIYVLYNIYIYIYH